MGSEAIAASNEEKSVGCDWIFTSFRPIDWEISFFGTDCTYFCTGNETCPETKRLHTHGFIQFRNRRKINTVLKLLRLFDAAIHLEPRRGTVNEAVDYVKKGGCWKEDGDLNLRDTQHKSKGVFEAALKMVKAGNTDRQILELFPQLMVHGKALAFARANCLEKLPDRPVKLFLLWGPACAGKSYRAKAAFPDYFEVHGANSLRSLMSYKGEKALIFDAFLSTEWPMTALESMIKEAVCDIPVLYGAVKTTWNYVVITTNQHPDSMWPGAVNRDAFFKRLTRPPIYVATRECDGGEPVDFTDPNNLAPQPGCSSEHTTPLPIPPRIAAFEPTTSTINLDSESDEDDSPVPTQKLCKLAI